MTCLRRRKFEYETPRGMTSLDHEPDSVLVHWSFEGARVALKADIFFKGLNVGMER